MDKIYFDFLPHNIINKLEDINELEEIRIRINKRVYLKYLNKEKFIEYKISKKEMEEILEKIFKGSRYSYQNEIVNGFITIEGGHRIGITGLAVVEDEKLINICNISSLNIRVSKEIKNVSKFLDKYIISENNLCNTLIASVPGKGKTTILKDLIRRISNGEIEELKSLNVGVVDERMELSGGVNAENMIDLGEKTDVITNISKEKGMKMLIRSMAPEVLVVDEIGTKEDIDAIKYGITSGVKGIFTAHSDCLENILINPILKEFIELNLLDRIVFLSKDKKCEIYKVYKKTDKGYIEIC